ncbi:hypothetical protein B0T12DRAFT_400317 [Alternaria alternata]|nr:hypothetical protein B0T12DRAFT_400317 [Alternaria alternata]
MCRRRTDPGTPRDNRLELDAAFQLLPQPYYMPNNCGAPGRWARPSHVAVKSACAFALNHPLPQHHSNDDTRASTDPLRLVHCGSATGSRSEHNSRNGQTRQDKVTRLYHLAVAAASLLSEEASGDGVGIKPLASTAGKRASPSSQQLRPIVVMNDSDAVTNVRRTGGYPKVFQTRYSEDLCVRASRRHTSVTESLFGGPAASEAQTATFRDPGTSAIWFITSKLRITTSS